MNGLFQAALEVQQFCRERKWPFCFIGGLAVLRWGEHRITRDIDLNLYTGFEDEENFVDELLRRFRPRIPDARQFALNNRVVLVTADNGVPADIALGGLPFEAEMIRRSSAFSFTPDCSIITCSAEDLIVLKTFAGREKDWLDIGGIVASHSAKLNTGLIFEILPPLLEAKDDSAGLKRLRAMLVSPK